MKIKIKCSVCGKEFEAYTCMNRKYCSFKCYNETKVTHNASRPDDKLHGIINSYWAMRRRCEDPNNHKYKDYGARGISVCKTWNTPLAFFNDMIGTYKPGLVLDRKDNNKGYSKDNCRWVTIEESNKNKRNVIKISTSKGLLTLVEASEIFNIEYQTLYRRYWMQGLREASGLFF